MDYTEIYEKMFEYGLRCLSLGQTPVYEDYEYGIESDKIVLKRYLRPRKINPIVVPDVFDVIGTGAFRCKSLEGITFGSRVREFRKSSICCKNWCVLDLSNCYNLKKFDSFSIEAKYLDSLYINSNILDNMHIDYWDVNVRYLDIKSNSSVYLYVCGFYSSLYSIYVTGEELVLTDEVMKLYNNGKLKIYFNNEPLSHYKDRIRSLGATKIIEAGE